MTITTEEFWDIDGTALNTLAFNIESLNGRSGVPVLRGDNVRIPYRSGAIWREKEPDSRVITLGMWVQGADENGVIPSGAARRRKFNDNLDDLKRLYYVTWRQLSLTKRWAMSDGLRTATALAEPVGAMEPSMLGRHGARLVLDFLLADPYFYGFSVASTLALATPLVINNDGHAIAKKMTVRLNGPLTNPVLTNATNGVSVTYTGVISGGAYVDLDTDVYTALTNLSANVVANVTHNGARAWMQLVPGNNTLTLNASAGSGNAVLTFRPPYV